VNIVTIFEYDLNQRFYVVMLRMLISSIVINCKSMPYTIHIITNNKKQLRQLFSNSNINIIQSPINTLCTDHNIHKNIRHKLYYLCNLNFDFIFIDCDMYVNHDLKYLWDRRHDKPFIGVNHQPNIVGTLGTYTSAIENNQYLNSGLQVVSDPDFLDYSKILKIGYDNKFIFDVNGFDQAILHTYFKTIDYEYTHQEVGYEWNSCASHCKYYKSNTGINLTYKNNNDIYPVKINHYWGEFKPWIIKCPIFKNYNDVLT